MTFQHNAKLALLILISMQLCACDSIFSNKSKNKNVISVEEGLEPLEADGSKILKEADRKRLFRWILKEMYVEVFATNKIPKQEMENWVNVLLQGASLEGIYHGFVLSTRYRMLEKGVASKSAQDFFTKFYSRANIPLNSSENVIDAEAKRVSAKIQSYPLFTLKSALGDRLLERVSMLAKDREKLADWYAKFVVEIAKSNIDLVLPQRSIKSAQYHYDWAMENSIGLLRWEVLFRVHHILNKKNITNN